MDHHKYFYMDNIEYKYILNKSFTKIAAATLFVLKENFTESMTYYPLKMFDYDTKKEVGCYDFNIKIDIYLQYINENFAKIEVSSSSKYFKPIIFIYNIQKTDFNIDTMNAIMTKLEKQTFHIIQTHPFVRKNLLVKQRYS